VDKEEKKKKGKKKEGPYESRKKGVREQV